ncbi:MAG: glutaredoxin family protein [Candidatus Hermodarchaeota archaeon]
MDRVKVKGAIDKHQVLLYALSTCGWCKMTKAYLRDSDISHEFIDVDKLTPEERETIHQDIKKRGSRLAFPTIIIDDETVITGFKKDEIKKALGI